LVRDFIVALQGSLLVRHAPSNVSDAFCASRLDGEGAPVFGLLPRGLDARGIAERAGPAN
jgi:putative acyl-CoA dehydrogenase